MMPWLLLFLKPIGNISILFDIFPIRLTYFLLKVGEVLTEAGPDIYEGLTVIVPPSLAVSIQEVLFVGNGDALQQRIRELLLEMRSQEISTVFRYGVAFRGKDVQIATD